MGPDELDDLLASIRAESKKESALALYEGTRETDLVSEEVDERILKLIGIDDVFDIDYSTYLTLLRERLAAARMTDSKIPVEEDELLRDEFRRVKGKVGRFKIKRKTISAGGIGVSGPITVSSDKFFLVSKAVIPTGKETEDGEETTSPEIMNKLDELIAAIRKDNELEKKKQEKDRRNLQNKRRRERESALEKVSKPVQRLMKKVVAPFQSILDRIMKFIGFTLLGFAFNKFVQWFADPKNQKKIQVIGRFLKDWWPSLLGAAALFFTPLGTFVKGVVGIVRFLLPTLGRLTKLLLGTKGGRIATAVLAVGGGIATVLKNQKDTDIESQRAALSKVLEGEKQQGPLSFLGFNQGGIIPSYNEGGMTAKNISGLRDTDGRITKSSGLDITGAGPDTQLIAAAPGEIVIPRETVEQYGSGTFMDMIRSSGKTGVPGMVNGIQLANQGGMVGGGNPVSGIMDWWNRGRNVRVPNENTARFGGLGQYLKKSPNPSTLLGDDALQITRGNKAFQSGATGYRGWNPFKAFTPNMVKTGPTPAIRQAVERPLRSFSKAPKMFKGLGGAAGSVLMDMIFPEPAFNPTLDDARRMGFPMGPQSKSITMPGTPVPRSNIQVINLPPETLPPQKAPTPVRSGTQIPEFSITSRNTHRSVVSTVLGIADLVG